MPRSLHPALLTISPWVAIVLLRYALAHLLSGAAVRGWSQANDLLLSKTDETVAVLQKWRCPQLEPATKYFDPAIDLDNVEA